MTFLEIEQNGRNAPRAPFCRAPFKTLNVVVVLSFGPIDLVGSKKVFGNVASGMHSPFSVFDFVEALIRCGFRLFSVPVRFFSQCGEICPMKGAILDKMFLKICPETDVIDHTMQHLSRIGAMMLCDLEFWP